jgi:hypothetical protein
MGEPVEILTTCAVHAGMDVHDDTIRSPVLHVTGEPSLIGPGSWIVPTDRGPVECGARHRWVVGSS